MKPRLEKLAEIAQNETYITYDELEGWPREQLEEEGYLKEAGRQSVITCDQCSERCPIPRDRVIQHKDDENMGLFPCEHNPDISFVDVNLDRYKQYRIIKRKLRAEGYYQESEDENKKQAGQKLTGKSKKRKPVKKAVERTLDEHPDLENKPTKLLVKVNAKLKLWDHKETNLETVKSTLTRLRKKKK